MLLFYICGVSVKMCGRQFVKSNSTTESFQDEVMDELTLEDEAFEEKNIVILGVCAMNKKVFYYVSI